MKFFLLVAFALAAPFTGRAHSDLYQRTCTVPGLPLDFIPEDFGTDGSPDYIRSFFEAKGIRFIEGSSVFYNPSTNQIVVSHVGESHLLIDDILDTAYTLTTLCRQAQSWIVLTEAKSGREILALAQRVGFLFDPAVRALVQQYTEAASIKKPYAPDIEPLLRHQEKLQEIAIAALLESRSYLEKVQIPAMSKALSGH